MGHGRYEDPSEEDVADVYERQARLTRKVGRGMLVFAIVWLPALAIVPGVFKLGAIWSMLLATIAALLVMIIVERTWMRPRAAERDRRARLPPPPAESRTGLRRVIDRVTERIPK